MHEAFSQIWGTRRLWCSHDVAGIRPPETDPAARADLHSWEYRARESLHWDREEFFVAGNNKGAVPLKFGVQGLLYLTDTPSENGALCCVPGFHHRAGDYLVSLPLGTTAIRAGRLSCGRNPASACDSNDTTS